MNENEENKSNEASNSSKKVSKIASKSLKIVNLRNRFLNIVYRNLIILLITSVLSLASSIAFLIFYYKQPIPPQFILVNEDGRYVEPPTLKECKTDSEVSQFVINALSELHKFDFINRKDQMSKASNYFSTKSWNEFNQVFVETGTLRLVEEKRLISTVDVEIPEITEKYEEKGICKWKVRVPMNIYYLNSSERSAINSLSGNARIILARQSVLNNPKGLVIETYIFQELNKK